MNMILRNMLKEEWRMHSEIFGDRSFAGFPITIFLLTLISTFGITEYSKIPLESFKLLFYALAGFIGLSVGSLGFSSRDALKNVLGPTNFLVYSSRTLPVSEKRLLSVFIIKDLIYYSFLFLLPVSLGYTIFAGLSSVLLFFEVFTLFSAGVVSALVFARVSVHLPGKKISYSNRMTPLAEKSFLDLWRSSGGLLKIVFSFIVLAGFYWTVALYFPFAKPFLQNPLLSFSVLAGTISLTVYNWLNRFDSVEEYQHLPVDYSKLLDAKQEAFLKISSVMVTVSLLISFTVYQGHLMLSLATGLATMLYTLGIAKKLTGLKPNEKLFDSVVFLKYLAANSLFVMPLLIFSVFYTDELIWYYSGMMLTTGLAGYALTR